MGTSHPPAVLARGTSVGMKSVGAEDYVIRLSELDDWARLFILTHDRLTRTLLHLGGGHTYLEAFKRLCFCGSCQINDDGPREKAIHSTACEDAWNVYSEATKLY